MADPQEVAGNRAVAGQQDRPDQKALRLQVPADRLEEVGRIGKPVNQQNAPRPAPVRIPGKAAFVGPQFEGHVGRQDPVPVELVDVHTGPFDHAAGFPNIFVKGQIAVAAEAAVQAGFLKARRQRGTPGQHGAGQGQNDHPSRNGMSHGMLLVFCRLRAYWKARAKSTREAGHSQTPVKRRPLALAAGLCYSEYWKSVN